MNKNEIMPKLNEIFIEIFDDEKIELTDKTTANDIEDWDSLAHLQLIATVEKKFGIHFTLGEINNFANVGELCDSIIKHLV